MNGGSERLPCSLLRVGAATVIIAGLLATCGVADARQSEAAANRIVALGFDAGTQTLLKAYPRALYRSSNAGRNWEPISLPASVARGRIASVAAPAHRKDVVYVAGPGFGVLRSENGGRSWVAQNTGLPSNDVVALTPHADQWDTIYAYLSRKGIFRSEDAGAHWRLMDSGPRQRISQFIHTNMPGSMQTGWFFAATPKGVNRSMDCFCGWRDAGGLARAITAVAYDPQQPKQVYAATGTGLLVSTDGGEQWSQTNSPGRVISALAVTPAGELYAAVGEGELFRSADHGKTWERIDA
ncbi:MAG TPA: hypothetical protein VGR65_10355 [Casimicrobiaceae bacterium]|nr:hypothetical protein [Casimicrobiaceae bacterium]